MRHLGAVCLVLLAALPAGGADMTPDPVAWAQEPHARISSAVTMAVEPLGPAGKVEYSFDCTEGPGHDCGWQTATAYTDKGLKPLSKCTYVVRARDKTTGKEIAPPSRPAQVTTRRAADHEQVKHGLIDKAIASGELECVPILLTGDKDNRINIIAINRWETGQRNTYNTPKRRDEFLEDARHILGAFEAGHKEALPPYPQYRNFFNVWAVWWPGMPPWNPQDRKNGMHWGDYNEIRARLFLPWQIEGRGWVTHLAMLNSSGGGGGAGRREDERVGDAMIVGNQIQGFIHEFNHTAPGIPDEYTSSGMWGRGGEGSTTTNEYRREHVKWRAWIDPDTPVPTPYSRRYLDKTGLFEGGVHRMSHLFRPTARGCIMGSGSFAGNPEQMCVVCRQRAVERLYHLVDAIDKTTPARKELTIDGPATLRFAVERVHPEPDTQKTEWRLNGRVIATGKDEIEVAFGPLAHYELAFALVDESPFVRHDPPYARSPRAETRWAITNKAPTSKAKPLTVALQGRSPVFKGVADGTISATVAGGRAPYTYHWDDGAPTESRTGLDAGAYRLTVVDAEFRKATAIVELSREEEHDPQLVAERRGGKWRLTVDGLKGGTVASTWSTGAKGRTLASVPDGKYSCVIEHKNGSRIQHDITLKTTAHPLSARVEEASASSGGENNGVVRLDVSGGRKPYRFAWSDGIETRSPARHFLAPGHYAVTVHDANRSRIPLDVTVKGEPAFTVRGLRVEQAGPGAVRIANPQPGMRYGWFAADLPAHLPRYPHGIYTGTFTADGKTCEAEAYVIQNKGGLYADERKTKNDYGHWTHLMAWRDGREADPMTVAVNTRGGRDAAELTVAGHTHDDTLWDGKVADGRLRLEGKGPNGGTFDLLFASHPPQPDTPLHVGTTFSPPKAGNYYVAAQKVDSGAVSRNRLGVAVTMGPVPGAGEPIAPDKVTSAKLLMWLDASDMDGDGKEDRVPPRRGAVMGWQGKAGGVHFKDFVYFQPNQQNGKGATSWETIWIQSLGTAVKGYRTICMVRREHDLSSVGTAPWRELNDVMGVGEFGKRLLSDKAAERMAKGAVYVNGAKVDPAKAPMPEGFYQVTYELPRKSDRGFHTSDGHWEGSVAECLAYDGKLTETERKGIEEYLRRKWLSAAHLTMEDGKR